MKRILGLCLGISLLASLAAAQSLGEIARRQRQQKKPSASRVYTNDDLPTSAPINIGAASTATEAKPAENVERQAEQKAATPEDKAKINAEWKARFDEQKKAISLLERELGVLQGEYKQQVALYYADAGNQLRDQRKWADEQRKYDADIAAKQKALAEARQKLEDMKEEARKAGVPSSVTD